LFWWSKFNERSDTKEESEDDDSSSTSSSNSSIYSDIGNSGSKDIAFFKNIFKFNYVIKINIGSINWVQQKMLSGKNPRSLLYKMFGASVPSHLEDITLWRVRSFYFLFHFE